MQPRHVSKFYTPRILVLIAFLVISVTLAAAIVTRSARATSVAQSVVTHGTRCDALHPLNCRRAVAYLHKTTAQLRTAIDWQRKQRLNQRQLPASNLTPVEVGRELARRRSWVGRQFACLYALWNRESGWQVSDRNWASQADGIPQANPASKMASAGTDWRTNAATQILWGLGYIEARYGTPCAALAHSDAHGYY